MECIRVHPWWRIDACAALALEEEGEPEGDFGAMGWAEGGCATLN